MSDWAQEDLAYDGSSEPQKRELTPRERDILCRIIANWREQLCVLQDVEPSATSFVVSEELLAMSPVGWMGIEPFEAQTILDMYGVLNPRAKENNE